MSFSPEAQFSMQLIQSLSEQIGQGRRQAQENQVLGQILPQIQESQSPESLLNLLLAPGLTPETQQLIGKFVPTIANQQQRQRQQQGRGKGQEQLANILDQVNKGQKSLEEAESDIAKIQDFDVVKEGLSALKSRRTDLRVKERLEGTDPQVKENTKLISELRSKANNAKEILSSIQRQKELVGTGKTSNISQATAAAFPELSRWLKNPESVELEAESLESLKAGVQLFGGGTRFTDAKLRLIMNTLRPGGGTQEQQLAALNALENIVKTWGVGFEALKKIRQDNPGVSLNRIPDLPFMIEEFSDELLDQIDSDIARIQQLDQSQQEQQQDERVRVSLEGKTLTLPRSQLQAAKEFYKEKLKVLE